MKLAIIGGGGVRSIFLIKSIASKADNIGINEVVLMDNDSEKLRVYGTLAQKALQVLNPKIKLVITTDPIEALKDADVIITAIRVGEDQGRVYDERIALKYGVLGQETTGAGGFAMAMRSIPAILGYCKLSKQYSKPDALIFNFTNPSGLVTQALRSEGFSNVYGICDSPSSLIKQVANVINVDSEDVSAECFGLNHLSYFRSFKIKGEEKIIEILNNPLLYIETEERLFEPELIKSLGMLLNGYLYFYYYRDIAIENISHSDKTRGETIREINKRMFDELKDINIEDDFEKAISIYFEYIEMREKSYMSIESSSGNEENKDIKLNLKTLDDEGYAGVALKFMEAKIKNEPVDMVLSVPNMKSINGLKDDDVVEITCRIDKDGASPIHIGDVTEIELSLIKQVKLYERLAVKAIKEKSIDKAIWALTVHPLINSYSIATKLVYEYINAHKDYIGEWR